MHLNLMRYERIIMKKITIFLNIFFSCTKKQKKVVSTGTGLGSYIFKSLWVIRNWG